MSDDVSPLAVSPDGRALVVAAVGSAGAVEVRDARSGHLQQTIARSGRQNVTQDEAWYLAVTALAYDPTGRQLAIGSRGGGIRLHDLVTGQERILFGHCGKPDRLSATAHLGPVRNLVWTGATTLVSAANDETLRRWALPAGREESCLSTPGGTTGLQTLPNGRLLALGATSATLIDGLTFRRVARLGPLAGELSELSVLGKTIRLFDLVRDRSWNVVSGQEVDLHGQPLAALDRPGVRVRVGPDMRVTVMQDGRTRTLSPPAVPPFNLDGSGDPSGWKVEVSGAVLTVTAASTVRILIMDSAEFLNVFRWNLVTGRLERCDTTSTVPTERDRACPKEQRSP